MPSMAFIPGVCGCGWRGWMVRGGAGGGVGARVGGCAALQELKATLLHALIAGLQSLLNHWVPRQCWIYCYTKGPCISYCILWAISTDQLKCVQMRSFLHFCFFIVFFSTFLFRIISQYYYHDLPFTTSLVFASI